MLQVEFPLKKNVLSEGTLAGTVGIVIKVNSKCPQMDISEVITSVLSFKTRLVVIKGKILENPELVTLAEGLIAKGKLVYFLTDFSDSIESLRRQRNIMFRLTLFPPNSVLNTVNQSNFPLLQESDEILVPLESPEEYEGVKKYFEGRFLTKPTVVFKLLPSVKVETAIEIVQKYLDDTDKFKFKNKLFNGVKTKQDDKNS